jgi:hypothetical protein
MLAFALAMLLLVAAAIVGLSARKAPTARGTRKPIDRDTQAWAGEIRRRLPDAFDALQLTAAGNLKNGRRPSIQVRGHGQPVAGRGWAFDLELPGSAIDSDIQEERIAGALNTGRVLVDVVEVRRAHPGYATVATWRRDPLKADNRIPFAPGALPVAKWGDRWSLGLRRDGEQMRLPLWLPGGGAFHHLFAGATGSGKTRWMLVGIAHAIQLGAEVYLVDIVKGVDDRDWDPIRPALAGAWDSPTAAVKALDAIHKDTLTRPRWEPTDAGRFRLIVVDELQSLTAAKGGLDVLTRMVAEGRSKGQALFGATQLPEVNQIASIARTNMRIKLAGRLDNEQEYRAALGGKWQGTKIPDNPEHWGVGYGDVDGQGAQRFRGWNVSDRWLAEHTRRCMAKR